MITNIQSIPENFLDIFYQELGHVIRVPLFVTYIIYKIYLKT